MKKSYIIIGVVVIVMLAAIGIYAVINSNSQSKKQLEENSTNIEGTTNTENSTKENNTENKDEYIQNNQISNESEENNMYSTGKHHAEIVVKNYGTIVLELDADVAPITVENFLKLIDEDFFAGLIFHRVIPGFMIQGGGYTKDFKEKHCDSIKGEFKSNGVNNELKHTEGVLSMARTMIKDSASSQFFIMHKPAPHLDGEYAAFGKITEGMDIVDKIATCETDWSDAPMTPVVMKTVTVDTFGDTYPEPEKC